MASLRRNLVIVCAGDESLHPAWLKGESRNFDICVSYFGEAENRFRDGPEYYEAVRGLKWPRLAEISEKHRDKLSAYDAVWLPDDDLKTDSSTINRMFDLFHEQNLALAQPALGVGSHISHRITAICPDTRLRFTNFVEIMCPIFCRETLAVLAPTFGSSVSGWGLDFVWPFLLGYPANRIAIMDATSVIHTRVVGRSEAYGKYKALKVDTFVEAEQVMKRYGLPGRPEMRVYGSVPHHLCRSEKCL